MNNHYHIRFFFQVKSEIEQNYNVIYSSTKLSSRFLRLPDIIKLLKGINDSDIFISSFLLKHYSLFGILFSHLLKKKIIIWEEISYLHNNARSKFRYWKMHRIAKYVNGIFVLGELQKKLLVELGVKSENIFVANEYPGFCFAKITEKIIPTLNLQNGKTILYIGKFVPLKGVEYLINAFNILSKERQDVNLFIVGEGPSENIYKILSRYNRNITIHPPIIDIGEKSYLFKYSSIVVVSSIVTKSVEGGPLVVLEALSAGTPVIVTNATGSSMQFIMDGVNGFVVPHSNEKAIYEKMKIILGWDKNVTRRNIIEYFNKTPTHSFQFEQLDNAIKYSSKN